MRKLCAGSLAVAVTVLLFRVMFRAANGRARLLDWELLTALALAALGLLWVKAARRVRPPGEAPTDAPAPEPLDRQP